MRRIDPPSLKDRKRTLSPFSLLMVCTGWGGKESVKAPNPKTVAG